MQCAELAEEVVGLEVGVRGALADDVWALAEDFSSFLLLCSALLAFRRFCLLFPDRGIAGASLAFAFVLHDLVASDPQRGIGAHTRHTA